MPQETEPKPAPREILRIQNFAGMTDVTLELSRMNVLIGPSASGKSVCAKLIYFFKDCVRELPENIIANRNRAQIQAIHKSQFLQYFPPSSWPATTFEINYVFGLLRIKVTQKKRGARSVSITYSDYFTALISMGRRALQKLDKLTEVESINRLIVIVGGAIGSSLSANNVFRLAHPNRFVSAGRSYFSTLQHSVFNVISRDAQIDPFVALFGRLYENMLYLYDYAETDDHFNLLFDEYSPRLLSGQYERTRNQDYIRAHDGRRITVQNSSSGQQEVLPLLIVLTMLAHVKDSNTKSLMIEQSTVFIEEPEAHLYPNAQRDVVHLMAAVTDLFGSNEGSQYVLTTHSPYILSALNNLMYAGKIVKEMPEKKDKVTAILPEAVLVDPANVRAYMMEDGGARSIISEKSGLLVPSEIDGVSNILGAEFNRLLDVEFDDEDEADEDAA